LKSVCYDARSEKHQILYLASKKGKLLHTVCQYTPGREYPLETHLLQTFFKLPT